MNSGDHMHGMGGPPPSNGTTMMHRRHMMMHMTFFWGKNAEILFDGWPGYDNLGMYILALVVVFLLALTVEGLSHCKFLRGTTAAPAVVGMVQTALYTVRIGLGYLVMLALMSFNVGVFLVAVLGHGIGFFFFGSGAFNKQTAAAAVSGKGSDLPPVNC
ncbi:Copper transporter [Handroanthus impetiginosus]|uniref:Copper transport protein n=1 Tax=Handroanthus impetiginosus TaxID=429701 RepID=A0A2G9HLT3_9LAMI|nr:Copper transporter [Handroanthus impetiginosus]